MNERCFEFTLQQDVGSQLLMEMLVFAICTVLSVYFGAGWIFLTFW